MTPAGRSPDAARRSTGASSGSSARSKQRFAAPPSSLNDRGLSGGCSSAGSARAQAPEAEAPDVPPPTGHLWLLGRVPRPVPSGTNQEDARLLLVPAPTSLAKRPKAIENACAPTAGRISQSGPPRFSGAPRPRRGGSTRNAGGPSPAASLPRGDRTLPKKEVGLGPWRCSSSRHDSAFAVGWGPPWASQPSSGAFFESLSRPRLSASWWWGLGPVGPRPLLRAASRLLWVLPAPLLDVVRCSAPCRPSPRSARPPGASSTSPRLRGAPSTPRRAPVVGDLRRAAPDPRRRGFPCPALNNPWGTRW
jgi:hypothetical protein